MSVAFLNPELFDLKIYLYTDGDTELKRRWSRDIVQRGKDIQFLSQSHVERRIQYEVFMHPYSRHFDIIIKMTDKTIDVEKNTFEFR
jgi:uridine kinase